MKTTRQLARERLRRRKQLAKQRLLQQKQQEKLLAKKGSIAQTVKPNGNIASVAPIASASPIAKQGSVDEMGKQRQHAIDSLERDVVELSRADGSYGPDGGRDQSYPQGS